MPTDCTSQSLDFEACSGRRVVADFKGGAISTDAGGLLLREADRAIGLSERVARCFRDGRNPVLTVHTIKTLVSQRVHGIALGYEDINDHDDLRLDPVLGLLSGKLEEKRADCEVLAGKSTLNRLEQAPETGNPRYHKISVDDEAMEAVFVDLYLAAHERPPKRIILDLDATDDPLHGDQEGRFYHGYYRCYCYLPLYIFVGRHLLVAKLRRADADASAGAKEEVARIVASIRAKWPDVEIWLRADSGFTREDLMAWCEANNVAYVFGLARNARLEKTIAEEMAQACAECEASGQPVRLFKEFSYSTLDSWTRERRVIAKAEHLPAGANPRFIVTSLESPDFEGQDLYEKIYCARGDMENRIKECQLDLFADRTSTATMRANQLRLWFASFAYVLIAALRRIALQQTQFARATAGTIRTRVLKIGAQVKYSVRRVYVAMASACPYQDEFRIAHARLKRIAA